MHGPVLLIVLTACGGSSKIPYAPQLATFTLSAQGGDGQNTLSWLPVAGALSYDLYWSNQPGVNKTTGTQISLVTSPYVHTGLANNTVTYYYVVVAQGSDNVSVTSNEASAYPATPTGPDPLFTDQWHLQNTGQAGGIAGEDINVAGVWAACGSAATCRGEGIRIAIVDDGLEIAHEDLMANVASALSYDYLTGGTDPTGGAHGTSVAGVAAARDFNGRGGRGVAPRANMVAYNLLAASTASNEADAATRGTPNVHVNTNSWGPTDGAGTLDASSALWRTAIDTGLSNGRDGKGTIYLWAAGNGAIGSTACPTCVDNANYDGYANYYAVIAVCAVGDDGKKAAYSERGANLVLCAPSLGRDNHGITTTDRTATLGYNAGDAPDYTDGNYTNTFNGTSAATPIAAGAVALMLQANPNLGWRDIRLILAQTARKNDASNSEWAVNAAGYSINHNYGFGVIDTQAAVTAAATWTNVGLEINHTTALLTPALPIPDNNGAEVSDTILVGGSGINKIEAIEVTVSATHAYSGNLEITLTGPTGTRSVLAEAHDCVADICTPYNAWVFSTVRHLGEAANGPWTLTIKDLASSNTGTFQSWQLKFYGRAS